MAEKKIRHTSEWKSFSELRPVQHDISNLGYKKEYIAEHELEEIKIFHWSDMVEGIMNFFEPLEVKAEGSEVFWRYNENCVYLEEPESFETQFGVFNNHNHGEFTSWLGKDDYEGLPEKEKEINSLFGRDDFFIEGNYCDMFDCGEYAYAVSNLMHMGLGIFKIMRIDKNLEAVAMYENDRNNEHIRLEYAGRFANADGYIVIVSGSRELEHEAEKREFQDITILFQIDRNGNCMKSKEWSFSISSANSMVAVGDYVYFGQNKMVTRLNTQTGETAFFTNKTDEELVALVKMW